MRCGKPKRYPSLYRLKAFIKRRNVSQRVMGKQLGISLDAMTNKLNGHTCFTIDELIRLAKVFDVPLGKMVKMIEDDYAESEAEQG